MRREAKERLKTILIFLLIFSGVIQVGILWSYQKQGTPTDFLSALFRKTPRISDEDVREALFVPDRLVLSGGEMSHWIMPRGSVEYNRLWDEAMQGLAMIVSGKASLARTNEEWGDITEKMGYMIDFGYDVRPELLSWFLGTKVSSQDFPVARKIMVRRDIIDESLATYYIRSNNGLVYVSGPIRNENAFRIRGTIEKLLGEENTGYRNYYTLGGSNIAEPMGAEPDVLYISGAPKYWPYYEYTVRPPAKASDEDELAEILLGTDKDRYSRSTGIDKIQFSFVNSFYEYHSNGYLSFNYLGTVDSSGEGGMVNALLNAYKFVAGIKGLLGPDVDIAIASINESKTRQGVYEIGFDYRIGGMPVMVDIDLKGGAAGKLSHAISIQADRKRVLKCDALLKDFVQGQKSGYNDRFIDLLGQSGMGYKDMNVQDMYCGYYIDSPDAEVLEPALLVYLKDGSSITLDMMPEEGD
ncbi:MAG: hypothetical protein ACOX4M_02185 [Acetivibrionales bacterium]